MPWEEIIDKSTGEATGFMWWVGPMTDEMIREDSWRLTGAPLTLMQRRGRGGAAAPPPPPLQTDKGGDENG